MKNVEGFWQMLSIQMLLFVYMAIGYGLRKGKILKAEARDAFTEFVILVTLPCMIFESFQITLTVETLQKGLLSLFVASSVEVLSLIISKPDIMVNPATPVMRNRITHTFISSKSSHANI